MEFKEAVATAHNMSHLCKLMNLNRSGGNYKRLRLKMESEGLDYSHFDSSKYENRPSSKGGRRLKDSEIFKSNSGYSTSNLHRRLIQGGYKDGACEMEGCHLKTPMWNGQPIRFHVDHINGVNTDHRLENLRILCPNCHSQTSTYCVGGKNYTRSPVKKYFCDCGGEKSRGANECGECFKPALKIDWPSKDVVLDMVEREGYSKTGRDLGVSDNAVRKYLKRV